MKSTQKFLCYSLALVGAALIFTASCKKDGDTIISQQNPVLNTNGFVVSTGGTSATAAATDTLASAGSSAVTEAGFRFTATAVSYTGSTTPTYTGASTATVPTSVSSTFSANLLTPAAASALSRSIGLTWVVSSYATNSNGTTLSASTKTITTSN